MVQMCGKHAMLGGRPKLSSIEHVGRGSAEEVLYQLARSMEDSDSSMQQEDMTVVGLRWQVLQGKVQGGQLTLGTASSSWRGQWRTLTAACGWRT